MRSKERFLFSFSGPPLIFLLLMTLRQKINGNWPAAFYPSGVLLLSAWAMGAFAHFPRFNGWRKVFIPGIVIGAALAVLTYSAPLVTKASGLEGSRMDPLIRLEGWEKFAQKVAAVRTRLPRPKETFLMTIGHRYLTSELAFYLPGKPHVYRWVESGEIQSQYELWPGPTNKKGWDCLIIIKGNPLRVPPRLSKKFQRLKMLKTVTRDFHSGRSRTYTLFLGMGWK